MENQVSTDKVMSLRLRPLTYAQLQELAETQRRSMAATMIVAIEEKYRRDVEDKK